jgi:hypothetical protein
MVPGEAEELLQEPNYELTQDDRDELIYNSTDVEERRRGSGNECEPMDARVFC